jgi:uncharacterized protein YbbK (DUF523 family)
MTSKQKKRARLTAVEKIPIGVSSCLVGEKVRYDGGHKLDPFVTEGLGRFFNYIAVCPEVEYGLPVPRETLRLVGDPASPRLVESRTGIDHTEGMRRWADAKLDARPLRLYLQEPLTQLRVERGENLLDER